MFVFYCAMVISTPLIYQMLMLALKPRKDNDIVYRSLIGPVYMGFVLAISMWVVLVLIPFSIFDVYIGIGWPLWKMFLLVSEISMIFFYFKPAVNWVRKVNGLPLGMFYEYPNWWA